MNDENTHIGVFIMMFLLMLFLMVSAGCGNQNVEKAFAMDTEFKPYIDTIERLYTDYTGDITEINEGIMLADLSDNQAGRCQWEVGNKRNRVILINRKVWDKETENYRLKLLLHELGHCKWELAHDPDKNTIMYKKVIYYGEDNDLIFESMLTVFFNKVKGK